MSEAEKRRKDRQELHELLREIEPAKNEDIARRAISIADYWLIKAENQAKHIKDLEARNSKQPTIEPKRGRWIRRPYDGIYCTECGKGWSYMLGAPGDIENYHYCPNCGKRMEEGAD